MPTVIPYIPSVITVHLGVPDSDAANVTVDFADYVKNVVSSEIYPTWEPQAIIALVNSMPGAQIVPPAGIRLPTPQDQPLPAFLRQLGHALRERLMPATDAHGANAGTGPGGGAA